MPGYSSTTLAAQGNGYLVKAVDYDLTTFTLTRTRYYRFYLSATTVSTTNSLLGFTVKYQGSF